ncbi:MAG: sugar transferase [Candidatus Cloacimonadota bacterium]|nr:MAG: sugar transferase [Candidatus Cloacimonadota bacterium]
MKSGAKDTSFFLTAIMLDLIALLAAFAFAYWLRFSETIFHIQKPILSFRFFMLFSFQIIIVWILVGYFAGSYDTKKIYPLPEQFYDIFRNTVISTTIALAMSFFYRPFSFSRISLIFAFFLIHIFVTTEKLSFRALKTYLFSKGKLLSRILVIGENPILQKTIDVINKDKELGFKIIEIIEKKQSNTSKPFNLELAGITEKVRKNDIEFVITAFPFERYKEIKEVLLHCRDLHINFLFVPDIFEIMISKVNALDLNGMPFFVLRQAPIDGWYGFLKRIIDVVFSFLFLIIASPLFIIIPMIIKVDTKGPVFYLQERVGKNEKIFNIIKFRSMIHKAEKKTGPVWANGKSDSRVTRTGKILRATHIDEIPQLINVLKNDMSLVGPRPERPIFVKKLKNQVDGYIVRHAVKPGLTGIAQLEHKYDSSIEDVREKVKFDRYYLENASFKLDSILIVRTIFTLLKRKRK